MAKFRVKVSGDLAKQFKGLEKKLTQTLQDELYAAALDIETESKRLVPVDTGVLKNSSGVRVDNLKFTVFYGAKYAPYIEYGTITRVNVPPEMQDNAILFKGSGIRKTGGIHARPFLYPAYKSVTKELPTKVDKALQSELDKVK